MKKYEVEVCRISYAFRTYGIKANSEEEAREKALDEATSDYFDEDSAEYKVDNSVESELSDEEFEEEYGD